ncbi:MAG: hypothetical protein CMD16_04800 [Flavobacteriales bacterium]|nr:hypothetical protein [Flavobacteriales bacterium]|tara:strand:- start:145 stop:648 length:504 start_codon:yes stop_codon:yes gene_type:complete
MVKVSNKVLLAGGLATAIGISGCKKYEDGPMFSLLTKKQRLTGEWEAKKVIVDGVNQINQNNMELELEFDSDGDFKLKSTYDYTYTNYYGQTTTYTYNNQVTGDWEFSNDKEEIELEYDEGGREDWEITRLTNKELEADITVYMQDKLFPELELDSKSDVRIECEKQ